MAAPVTINVVGGQDADVDSTNAYVRLLLMNVLGRGPGGDGDVVTSVQRLRQAAADGIFDLDIDVRV